MLSVTCLSLWFVSLVHVSVVEGGYANSQPIQTIQTIQTCSHIVRPLETRERGFSWTIPYDESLFVGNIFIRYVLRTETWFLLCWEGKRAAASRPS
jgi:hypothetical protein